MKISRNDPFDLKLLMKGLGVLITYLHSDAYEYMYYFTFKRTLKAYAKEFNHAWDQSIDHDDFFAESEDLFVQNARSVQDKLIQCKLELILRFGIDEEEDLSNEDIVLEAKRFRPYILVHKRSKSYKKLKLYYERILTGYIGSLYLYACAITAQSYKIPLVLKKQFHLPAEESLRLLNQDEDNVALLKDLITALKIDLAQLRRLIN